MKFTNRVYGALKAFTLIVLPATGTFYFALANAWSLPQSTNVVGSIAALTTFLGTVLHISSSRYTPPTDGQMIVDKSDPTKDVYSLELSTPVEELAGKQQITLGVGPKTPVTPPVSIPPST